MDSPAYRATYPPTLPPAVGPQPPARVPAGRTASAEPGRSRAGAPATGPEHSRARGAAGERAAAREPGASAHGGEDRERTAAEEQRPEGERARPGLTGV